MYFQCFPDTVMLNAVEGFFVVDHSDPQWCPVFVHKFTNAEIVTMITETLNTGRGLEKITCAIQTSDIACVAS